MEIFLLFLGVIAIILGILLILDGDAAGLFMILLGGALCLIFIAVIPDFTYDVSCGENTYESVSLSIDQNYLKITGPENLRVYEDGPCEWTYRGR